MKFVQTFTQDRRDRIIFIPLWGSQMCYADARVFALVQWDDIKYMKLYIDMITSVC